MPMRTENPRPMLLINSSFTEKPWKITHYQTQLHFNRNANHLWLWLWSLVGLTLSFCVWNERETRLIQIVNRRRWQFLNEWLHRHMIAVKVDRVIAKVLLIDNECEGTFKIVLGWVKRNGFGCGCWCTRDLGWSDDLPSLQSMHNVMIPPNWSMMRNSKKKKKLIK